MSDILSWLLYADECILLAVNSLHSPFFDWAMWWASDRWVWMPLYIVLAGMVFCRYGMARGMICLMAVAVLIVVTDQTCATIIRPAIGRLRPSSPENPVSSLLSLVNGYHGGRFGFPSCHAANTSALAVFMSLVLKKRWWTVLLATWSALVSYSRVYLGVHYPGDILGGFLVGGVFAALCYRLMILSFRISTKSGNTFAR